MRPLHKLPSVDVISRNVSPSFARPLRDPAAPDAAIRPRFHPPPPLPAIFSLPTSRSASPPILPSKIL